MKSKAGKRKRTHEAGRGVGPGLMVRPALMACAAVMIVATCASAQQWDLSGLPQYQPDQRVSGTIRNFGSPLNGLLEIWENGFRKYHPAIRFEDNLPSTDAAVAGLVCGVADLATSGREPMFQEWEAFSSVFKSDMVDITVATGTYDIKTTWSLVVVVNKDNPISKLTMKQLDGIFGAERTGGFRGFRWMSQAARSETEDIRTWGQLGLMGEWADRAIQTSGYVQDGVTTFFQLKVFKGGDKWNPNYRQYQGGTSAGGDKWSPTYPQYG